MACHDTSCLDRTPALPHLVLEISRSLAAHHPIDPILLALHETASSTGIVLADDLKIRAMPVESAWIAGRLDDFAHLTVALLEGRSDEQKTVLSESLLRVLCIHLPEVERLSVELRDMHAASYRKRRYAPDG